MENRLKQVIREKGYAVGTFLDVATPEIVEILGMTGLDYVVIDTEHGTYDLSDVSDLIRAADSRNMGAVVRVSDPSHREIQHALDNGADAVIVPLLRKFEDFQKAAALAKFPPIGCRGFSKGRGSCFGNAPWAAGTPEEYMENSNEKTLLIPQCETLEALEQIEKIVEIDGVDGIFVGPFDLSICMGIPTRFEKEEFRSAVTRILNACKEAGKLCLIYTSTPVEARMYLDMGFDAAANSLDANEIARVYREMISAIRKG